MSSFIKALLISVLVLTGACKVSVDGVFPKKSDDNTVSDVSAPAKTGEHNEGATIKTYHGEYDRPLVSITSPEYAKKSQYSEPEVVIEDDSSESFEPRYETKSHLKNDTRARNHSEKNVAKAGLLLPLSGQAKKMGSAMQSAAMMALSKSGNKNFTLQFYDTKSTADGAYAAVGAALDDGVDIILGPLFGYETAEVASAIRWHNVNVISFSSDPENLSENVFSIAPMLSEQVTQIVDYACSKGYKRFAIVAQNNKMGEYVFAAAKDTAESETCGGQITATSFYEPETKDFSQTIKEILPEAMLAKLERERLKEQGYEVLDEPLYDSKGNLIDENNIVFDFDAVLVVDEGPRLRSLVSMLEYYDVTPDKVKLLGTSTFDDPKAKKENSFRQSWYVALPSANFAKFANDYKELTGSKTYPPRIASLTYDAVSLASSLAKSGELNTEGLINPRGFYGIDGKFRFLPDGRVERALPVMTITKNGQSKVVRKAPTTFPEEMPAPITSRALENIKPVPPATTDEAATTNETTTTDGNGDTATTSE